MLAELGRVQISHSESIPWEVGNGDFSVRVFTAAHVESTGACMLGPGFIPCTFVWRDQQGVKPGQRRARRHVCSLSCSVGAVTGFC